VAAAAADLNARSTDPILLAARPIDCALVRRLLPLAIFLVFAAGCSVNKPGEKTVAPLPVTVIGTVPTVQQATVPAQYKNGDAVAGKQVFETAGCKGCHTLKDAGATGTVGPNLDQVKPPLSRVVPQVLNGGPQMPPFKGSLSAKQIADVAAYVVKATGGNPNG
jgi:cytochrome c6